MNKEYEQPKKLDIGDILRISFFEDGDEDECRGLTGWQHKYYIVTEVKKKSAKVMSFMHRTACIHSKVNINYPFNELYSHTTTKYVGHISQFYFKVEDITTHKLSNKTF